MNTGKPGTGESVGLPVDLIRVVAVVLVLLLHASIESYTNVALTGEQSRVYWWTTALYDSFSRVCVPLFVMLSGFLLLQPSKVNEPIRVFLKKRFTRLGLAFGFWSVIYFAWSYYVHGQQLSVSYVIQGLLTGPYFHFWYVYLIAGLYLITPILRVVVSFGGRKILRYLILVWFVGASLVPLFELITGYSVNANLILIAGWIGYFVAFTYLKDIRVRVWLLALILALGIFWTTYGSWLMMSPLHYMDKYYFFYDALSINVIMASVASFMLLSRVKPDWPGTRHPTIGKVARAISVNSLPIYLGHLIVMESLQLGFFGFKLSLTVINPVIEIPALTVVTLFVTLGWVLVMSKVPVLKRLIGSR